MERRPTPAARRSRTPSRPAPSRSRRSGNSAFRRRPWSPSNGRNGHGSTPACRSRRDRPRPRPGCRAAFRYRARIAWPNQVRYRTAPAARRPRSAGSSAPPARRPSAGRLRRSADATASGGGPEKISAGAGSVSGPSEIMAARIAPIRNRWIMRLAPRERRPRPARSGSPRRGAGRSRPRRGRDRHRARRARRGQAAPARSDCGRRARGSASRSAGTAWWPSASSAGRTSSRFSSRMP